MKVARVFSIDTLTSPSRALALTALFSIACVAAALGMQHIGGYDPCALCVEQRMSYLAGALISLVGLAIARRPRALIGTVAAAAVAYGWGLFTAARQVWLQAFPPKAAGCVLPKSLADDLGLADALPQVFAAGGDCLDGTAKFLGLTMPQASLLALAVLVAFLALVLVLQLRSRGARRALQRA
jgi:disulfide bond formation protein DsbB